MKKKNVYELALIRVKQELTSLELVLKEKNANKKALENILLSQEKIKKELEKEMKEKKEISPSISYFNRMMDYNESQNILSKINKIDYEILAFKKEYMRIKQRKEKIIEQKEKKENEVIEMKTKKEIKSIQNDYISKRYLK
ncbi:hypothetical protein AAGG74_18345 [Bacillus mexicanus]|uniref:hypothetical protein n=1 Tax=Bacillus mexicanus TaxID=2834415 RepID=UPI003D2539DF